jgi:hypothetical protein
MPQASCHVLSRAVICCHVLTVTAWIRRHSASAVAFGDFGAFLRYAVQEAISDVTGHYLESGYSWQAKSVD